MPLLPARHSFQIIKRSNAVHTVCTIPVKAIAIATTQTTQISKTTMNTINNNDNNDDNCNKGEMEIMGGILNKQVISYIPHVKRTNKQTR